MHILVGPIVLKLGYVSKKTQMYNAGLFSVGGGDALYINWFSNR